MVLPRMRYLAIMDLEQLVQRLPHLLLRGNHQPPSHLVHGFPALAGPKPEGISDAGTRLREVD